MKLPNASPTQKFLDILDIKDDILVLKGPRFCMVLETTALNFDLLSEKEQDAAIYAYANFVNSLRHPLQVVIKTRQVNIDNYLKFLEEQEKIQPSEALRSQINSYIKFIRQLVIENVILNKRFFIVIPYQEVGISKGSLFDPLLALIPFLKKPAEASYDQASFQRAKDSFEKREQEITWHFRRLGIEIKRLNTTELVKLFFEIYHPETESQQAFLEDAEGYLTPLVKPALT
ncbi:hypothetical protein B5M47_00205 [candidate division CPR3 bacterium 4484_211]|uniref:Uncharacterized protein n=1 Tax=candidate division CPR3 bacterium 4484_211 TaxID=1968527 RepID=A0A1W9NZN6_UNCC3|nr:MAG: hypothetical protein B5M47_00205 [candidate division CPR3 bacterium 4484_211]